MPEKTCKGICIRHKAQKPVGSGRYAIGQRRCQICEIFIKWEGLWCPCCGYRLRTKPRNLKYKAKLREKNKKTPVDESSTACKSKKTKDYGSTRECRCFGTRVPTPLPNTDVARRNL